MGSMGIWLAIALSNLVGAIALPWISHGNWTKAVIKRE
jgi:hypothetical protein